MQRSLWEIIMIILEKKKVYEEAFTIIGLPLHLSIQAILHRCRVTGETVDLAQVKKAHPCFYKMPKCLSIPLLKHDTYLHIFLKHFA